MSGEIMPLHNFVRTWFVAMHLFLMSAGLAQAGMPHLDCRYPMVFQGAAVNVVVLPYAYAGDNHSLTNVGNRLSLLIKLDVLSHILDYGSVGAVQMEMPPGVQTDGRSCGPETVLPILLGTRPSNPALAGMFGDNPEARNTLRSGHGLVLVWGLLYEEGDDIFIQTYARFLRRDTDETITFQAGGSSFSAKPSAQFLAFTPQKFTRGDLQQIEDSYRRADYVRDLPNDSAPGDQLPLLVAKCAGPDCDDSAIHAGFYVEEKRGEWIRIQYMDPIQGRRKEGWIHAAGGLSGTPLDKILPELKFIEGCAGYLRLRVAAAEQTPEPPGGPALAEEQLNAFVRSNESQPADITGAVALQLAGAVNYISGRDHVEALVKAADEFERARKMIPYDPNAITLAVGAQVAQEWSQKGRCEQTTQKSERLSTALAFSSDKAALANLNNFYTLLLKSPEPAAAPAAENLNKQAVTQRVEALKSVVVPK
jgi:hypothetical protein